MTFDPPKGFIESVRSAARMGDCEKLTSLTNECGYGHPVLNEKKGDIMGLTPLHWSVAAGQSKGRLACLEALIKAGADIEGTNNGGFTPLHYACATGKTDCAALLLQNGANVDVQGFTNRQTSLHCAAQRGDEECVTLLLDNGAYVNIVDSNGDTPLHFARRFGKTECEKVLLTRGADTSIRNTLGELPLENNPLPITNYSYE